MPNLYFESWSIQNSSAEGLNVFRKSLLTEHFNCISGSYDGVLRSSIFFAPISFFLVEIILFHVYINFADAI